jgi:hypothetical protein
MTIMSFGDAIQIDVYTMDIYGLNESSVPWMHDRVADFGIFSFAPKVNGISKESQSPKNIETP